MNVRVLLVDDQAMVRTGFRLVLDSQRDLDVVGEARDGIEAYEQAVRLRPDVVLMDVRMPRMDGIEATRRIVAALPSTRVLVLTTFDLDDYLLGALNAGAAGFLLKTAGAAELLAAVRSVHAGDAVVAPAATRRLLDWALPLQPPTAGREELLEGLSEREREVLVLVAEGLTNSEIAGRLFLAESTVKSHINRLLAKLAARDRVQLVIRAYEAGLVSPPGPGAG